MKQRTLDKLNAFLAGWEGANAFLNTYIDEHERLVVGLSRPDNASDFIGVCFLNCVFISGPTRWANCNLSCVSIESESGAKCLEVCDLYSGFQLRCEGSVIIGNGEIIFNQES